jgi:hypothetical protein
MSSVGTSKKMRRPHLCDICGKSYTQLPGLKYHMQSVHGMSDQVTLRPGTNVMIFKKKIAEIFSKEMAFLTQNKAKICKILIITLGFEKTQIFRR